MARLHNSTTWLLGMLCAAATVAHADEPRPAAPPQPSPPPQAAAAPAGLQTPAVPQSNQPAQAAAPVDPLRAQAMQRMIGLRNAGWILRGPRDKSNGRERLLWLVPGGLLVVELDSTINGAPYWSYYEGLLDEMLAEAPAGWIGPKWDSMLRTSRVARGPYSYARRSDEQLATLAKQYDADGDGIVAREEARMYLAQIYSGTPLTIMNGVNRFAAPPVGELLDTDGDGTLSAAEIAAAAERLQSRDANDDELLDAVEFTGPGQNPYIVRGGVQPGTAAGGTLFMLDDETDWARIHQALVQRYGREGKLGPSDLPLVAALAQSLDANSDGALSVDELARLRTVPPQIRLSLRLGETGAQPGGLTVERAEIAPGAELAATRTGDVTTLEVAGVRLQFAGGNPPAYANYDAQIQSIFTMFDGDKNGYLEKTEIDKQPGYAQQFAAWDADGDGKVYADDIKKSYERMQAPQMNRIMVGASELGNSLFGALDANGDGRLSRRELAAAARRLLEFDRNGNGQLEPHEVPVTVRLGAGRSNYAYQYLQAQQFAGYRPPGQPAAKPPGPDWFHRMDRNGDGDVSPREFLGDAEQFRALDRDGDGLLSLSEAEQK